MFSKITTKVITCSLDITSNSTNNIMMCMTHPEEHNIVGADVAAVILQVLPLARYETAGL